MKTADEYLIMSIKALQEEKNWRDLGKAYAAANEHYQSDWINKNTFINVEVRDDFDTDKDAGGYDIVSLDDKKMKIQSKIRINTIHLEQTRRKSKKHEGGASTTGHVTYKVDETDVFLISRPNKDDYSDMKRWELIALPAKALENPKNPGYIYNNVPKKIWTKYVGKTKEVLEEVYESI